MNPGPRGTMPLPRRFRAGIARRRLPRAGALLCALLCACVLLPGLARAQFTSGAYPNSTVAAVLKRHAGLLAQAAADPAQPRVDEAPQRYRLLVTYGGERRAIGADARALIGQLGEVLPVVPRGYLALFRQEIGVDADGRRFWMPVRAQLLPFVDTELARGDPIYVYAVFIGAAGPRPVLLVNEFKKARVQ